MIIRSLKGGWRGNEGHIVRGGVMCESSMQEREGRIDEAGNIKKGRDRLGCGLFVCL